MAEETAAREDTPVQPLEADDRQEMLSEEYQAQRLANLASAVEEVVALADGTPVEERIT